MSVNMANRPVSVSVYQPSWKDDFHQLKKMYEDHFGDLIIAIHHVGSTSVEGLAAKPRIDIDIEISRLQYELVKQKLGELDYQYIDLDIVDRNAFKYIGEKKLPAHNMYVCPSDSRELARHLAFRDYLRTHEDAIELYSSIKLDAITKGADHIDEYMDHKGKVVTELLVKALDWKGISPTIEQTGTTFCKYCDEKELKSTFGIKYIGGGDKREFIAITCTRCGKKWQEILEE